MTLASAFFGPHSLVVAKTSSRFSTACPSKLAFRLCNGGLLCVHHRRLHLLPRQHKARLPPPASQPEDELQQASRSMEVSALDANQLQTALNVAIASEDYALAAKIRDTLRALMGDTYDVSADWQNLGVLPWLAERAERLGFRYPTEVQKRSVPVIADGNDCIVRSATGSGKTMAFVPPLLSRLDYPPDLLPEDLQGPECVLLVPTRELGVQLVMLIYKMFGGSVSSNGVPGEASNMFAYSGPRGLKVKGIVLPEEVDAAKQEGYLKGVHVVVATPQLLSKVLSGPDALDLFHDLKVLAVDEVDECFKVAPSDMCSIMTLATTRWQHHSNEEDDELQRITGVEPQKKPQVVFVGATVESDLADEGVNKGWLDDPISISVGSIGVPRGLSHRYIIAEEDRKVALMARQMRDDLKQQGQDAPPARVMVFARSEEEARTIGPPLRNVLWGEHKVALLLPDGEDPIKALHSFRDNRSSLLVCTPSAARGLDLPAVTHVYNLALPESSTAYLHRAGRAGRIGSTVKGVVTTMVTEEELPLLQKMATELKIDLVEESEPVVELDLDLSDGDKLQAAKKGLEDIFNLF